MCSCWTVGTESPVGLDWLNRLQWAQIHFQIQSFPSPPISSPLLSSHPPHTGQEGPEPVGFHGVAVPKCRRWTCSSSSSSSSLGCACTDRTRRPRWCRTATQSSGTGPTPSKSPRSPALPLLRRRAAAWTVAGSECTVAAHGMEQWSVCVCARAGGRKVFNQFMRKNKSWKQIGCFVDLYQNLLLFLLTFLNFTLVGFVWLIYLFNCILLFSTSG